jgi:5'-nucleotidase
MALRNVLLAGLMGAAVTIPTAATLAAELHPGVIHSHSNEADHDDERLSNASARARAAERVGWQDKERKRDPYVRIKLLGINDFHGQLAAGRRVGTRAVGGAAVLASYLKSAATRAEDGHLIIHAGDHVGASPPDSALLQDEPSISFLNQLANSQCRYVDVDRGPWNLSYLQPQCNLIGTLGNHEFDDGVTELLRLIDGGTHAKGPFLEKRWRGARFPYISANVVSKSTGEPLLSPFTVRWFKGVPVGIIGAVLKETPTIVTPSGVAGVNFLDEATEINKYAQLLKHFGVKAIVVTIHQGIRQTSYEGPTNPDISGLSGPVVDIVRKLSKDVDVVVSGHAHGFTNALINTDAGHPVLVTQAFSASTAYSDIDITLSRKTHDVIEKSAVVVTTWADAGPGLTPDSKAAALAAAAAETVEPLVNRLVGVAQNDITVTENSAGESTMGNLIADAQRSQTNAQFAFMNPGGIRAGLTAGEITWGELFTVQPFGNDLVSMDLTGAQIRTLLEQQWAGQTGARILKTSGLTYTWDASRPVGQRVVEIRDASNQLLGDTTVYRVTVNSFIAAGGDNFFVLTEGTNRVVGPVDLDALVEHIESLAQPFNPTIEGRILRLN